MPTELNRLFRKAALGDLWSLYSHYIHVLGAMRSARPGHHGLQFYVQPNGDGSPADVDRYGFTLYNISSPHTLSPTGYPAFTRTAAIFRYDHTGITVLFDFDTEPMHPDLDKELSREYYETFPRLFLPFGLVMVSEQPITHHPRVSIADPSGFTMHLTYGSKIAWDMRALAPKSLIWAPPVLNRSYRNAVDTALKKLSLKLVSDRSALVGDALAYALCQTRVNADYIPLVSPTPRPISPQASDHGYITLTEALDIVAEYPRENLPYVASLLVCALSHQIRNRALGDLPQLSVMSFPQMLAQSAHEMRHTLLSETQMFRYFALPASGRLQVAPDQILAYGTLPKATAHLSDYAGFQPLDLLRHLEITAHQWHRYMMPLFRPYDDSISPYLHPNPNLKESPWSPKDKTPP